jgi:hypothetical protein
MWKTKWRKLCVVTMASSLKALLVLHDYGRTRKKTGLDGGVFSPQYGASTEIVDCTGYDRAASRGGPTCIQWYSLNTDHF